MYIIIAKDPQQKMWPLDVKTASGFTELSWSSRPTKYLDFSDADAIARHMNQRVYQISDLPRPHSFHVLDEAVSMDSQQLS